MIDAHVHLEKGKYCVERIQEFIRYALVLQRTPELRVSPFFSNRLSESLSLYLCGF